MTEWGPEAFIFPTGGIYSRAMKKIVCIIVAVLAFLISACGVRAGEQAFEVMDQAASSTMLGGRAMAVPEADTQGAFVAKERLDDGDGGLQPGAQESERKIIKNGSMEFEVEDLEGAEQRVTDWVGENGGYTASSGRYQTGLHMVLKIPAEHFDLFYSQAGDFGTILAKHSYVNDVTMQFFDLENRIQNKRILQERLQEYLSSAENIEELIAVENQLNEVTLEIERLEGSFKNLGHRISYSTINLDFTLPPAMTVEDRLPSLGRGFREFGFILARFFYLIFFVIIGLVILGVPAVLVIGGIYFLTFGRIGLVKNFFRVLGSKRHKGDKTS